MKLNLTLDTVHALLGDRLNCEHTCVYEYLTGKRNYAWPVDVATLFIRLSRTLPLPLNITGKWSPMGADAFGKALSSTDNDYTYLYRIMNNNRVYLATSLPGAMSGRNGVPFYNSQIDCLLSTNLQYSIEDMKAVCDNADFSAFIGEPLCPDVADEDLVRRYQRALLNIMLCNGPKGLCVEDSEKHAIPDILDMSEEDKAAFSERRYVDLSLGGKLTIYGWYRLSGNKCPFSDARTKVFEND